MTIQEIFMPMKTHYTQRLTLRPLEKRDIPYLAEMDSDQEVTKYIRPAITYDEAIVDSSRYFKMKAPKGGGIWAMESTCDNRFLGWIILIYLDDTKEMELGYRMLAGAWGEGYATEAAKCIASYALNELRINKLVAVTHPDNKASWNVLENVGFEHHGKKRAYDFDCEYFVLKA